MNRKQYTDVLTEQAKKNNRPYEMALSDFMDYLLEFWSIEALNGGKDHYEEYVRSHVAKNPDFAELMFIWLDDVATAQDHGQWIDVFGQLYEEMYLSRSKAAKTGQFFTPVSVSNLMARIATFRGEHRHTVNDCAAGSGRLLLSHFMEVSKDDHSAGRRYVYVAQDSDIIACKMCALNMMAHGMYGAVYHMNTLTMSTPTVVYHINEARYPISTPYYSIRAELAKK